MMKPLVVAGIVLCSTLFVSADSRVIPLTDPADPVRITNSMLQFDDEMWPMMTLELENATASPVETRDIWLSRARFFTQSEAAMDRKLWECGLASNAAHDEPSKVIPPMQRVTVRVSMTTSCEYRRDYQHFFVYITSIGRRVSESQWTREPGEFGRLLDAAMPHQ